MTVIAADRSTAPAAAPAWRLAGWALLAVGGLGAAIPLAPTTPLWTAAARAFERAGDRAMAERLQGLPKFGARIRRRLRGLAPSRAERAEAALKAAVAAALGALWLSRDLLGGPWQAGAAFAAALALWAAAAQRGVAVPCEA
ncbi:MAG: DUF454 family protein [Caulobacteraceae bacterium]|nr:DUF454 family protein [Caulobacteraceae bacterium]